MKRLVNVVRGLKLRLKYHWLEVLVEEVEEKIWKLGVCIGGVREILTKEGEGIWFISCGRKLIWVVSSL